MQIEDRDKIKIHLSEDLLVSLGAIRMALSWVIDDLAEAGVSSTALRRVENEVTALQDRTKVINRTLRETRPDGFGQVETQIPSTLKAEVLGAVPEPVAEPVAEIHSLEDTLVMRPRDGRGLPPTWLTDLDSAEHLDAELEPNLEGEPELTVPDEPHAPVDSYETPESHTPIDLNAVQGPSEAATDSDPVDQTIDQDLGTGTAGADLGDSIEALLSSALAARNGKKVNSSAS